MPIHQSLTFHSQISWCSYRHEIEKAVLSIPSFEAYGCDIIHFTATIRDFLKKSKAAGMTKALIDVQQNAGGNTFFAFKKGFETSDLIRDPQADDAFSSFPILTPLKEADCVLIQRQMFWVLHLHNFGTLQDWIILTIIYCLSTSGLPQINADTGRNQSSWETADEYYIATLQVSQFHLWRDSLWGRRSATSPQPYAAEEISIVISTLVFSHLDSITNP